MDYHTNIFYYYGRDESSAEGETQLENNTTKALINTLQFSSPQITSQFLTDVLDTQVFGERFRFHFQSERSSHELQNAIKKAKKLFVLALTPNGHKPTGSMGSNAESFIKVAERYSFDKKKILKFIDETKTKFLTEDLVELDHKSLKNKFPKLNINSLTKEDIFDLYDHYIRGSIPDAWIYWDQNVVLIENKTKSEVTRSQIGRHLKLLSKYNHKTKPVRVIKSWRKNISKYLARLKADEQSSFLIGQLMQYLEAINMGELKFTHDDFLAFDELDAGQVKQIRSAHERVYNLGEMMVARVLPNHRVYKQKIQANYAGINLVSEDYLGKKPVQVPHYSLAVRGNFLFSVYVTIESKSLINRLAKRHEKEKKALEYRLEEVLSDIDVEGYFFRINDKWHVTSGGHRHSKSTWHPLVDIPFDMLFQIPNWGKLMLEKIVSLSTLQRRKETIDKIIFLRKFPGKSVHATVGVGRNFKWHYVHERKANIVKDIEESILALKPYYEFIRDVC